MSFNGKIRARRGKDGISKTFFVVENFRRKDNGRPANRIVLYLGTLNPTELTNPLERQKFWRSAEKKIDAAILTKKLPLSESKKVKDKLKSSLLLSKNLPLSDVIRQELFEKYQILKQ